MMILVTCLWLMGDDEKVVLEVVKKREIKVFLSIQITTSEKCGLSSNKISAFASHGRSSVSQSLEQGFFHCVNSKFTKKHVFQL